MTRSIRSSLLVAITLIAVALLTTRSYSDDAPAEWKAPPDAAAKANPVPMDDKSNAAGKRTYIKNCQACHGIAGHGDGPAAGANKPRPRDLSDPQIASQTDGEYFWKITTGRKPMPGYEQKLTEEQRWQVVNYLRVLEPRPTTKAAQ
jgi:mono/diheme cytochrome c family protein